MVFKSDIEFERIPAINYCRVMECDEYGSPVKLGMHCGPCEFDQWIAVLDGSEHWRIYGDCGRKYVTTVIAESAGKAAEALLAFRTQDMLLQHFGSWLSLYETADTVKGNAVREILFTALFDMGFLPYRKDEQSKKKRRK